jgi:UDPglucose 6-dehydrogenase
LSGKVSYAIDAYDGAKGADGPLIITEWKEFAALDLARIKLLLNIQLCWMVAISIRLSK